jgi:hypothetical protein
LKIPISVIVFPLPSVVPTEHWIGTVLSLVEGTGVESKALYVSPTDPQAVNPLSKFVSVSVGAVVPVPILKVEKAVRVGVDKKPRFSKTFFPFLHHNPALVVKIPPW